MLVIKVEKGTCLCALFPHETFSFWHNGAEVDVSATNSTGPILLSFRQDKRGRLWIGGWRKLLLPLKPDLLSLISKTIYSDKLFRIASTDLSTATTKMYKFNGIAPIQKGEETIIQGKNGQACVVTNTWLQELKNER